MKKKLYDQTIGGYYVMSIVLGLLLALSIAMWLEVTTLDLAKSLHTKMPNEFDWLWTYLPLNLARYINYWEEGSGMQTMNLLMITAAILTIGIFVRMSGTQKNRTKILQTISCALFALLVMLAYSYAMRPWINGAMAIVPVLLMVIPLIILRKTQQPLTSDDLIERLKRLTINREAERLLSKPNVNEAEYADFIDKKNNPHPFGMLLGVYSISAVIIIGIVWFVQQLFGQ